MSAIDTSVLVNWVISGFIGLIFGVISAWVTYRYGLKRDDISWEREKTKLQQQFQHDRELLKVQFEQRIQELEQQLAHQEQLQLREKLTQGIENANQTIENIQRSELRLTGRRIKISPEQLLTIAALLAQAASQIEDLQRQWEGMGRYIPPQLVQALIDSQHALQRIADRFMAADQE
jgi:hypothetical protein